MSISNFFEKLLPSCYRKKGNLKSKLYLNFHKIFPVFKKLNKRFWVVIGVIRNKMSHTHTRLLYGLCSIDRIPNRSPSHIKYFYFLSGMGTKFDKRFGLTRFSLPSGNTGIIGYVLYGQRSNTFPFPIIFSFHVKNKRRI